MGGLITPFPPGRERGFESRPPTTRERGEAEQAQHDPRRRGHERAKVQVVNEDVLWRIQFLQKNLIERFCREKAGKMARARIEPRGTGKDVSPVAIQYELDCSGIVNRDPVLWRIEVRAGAPCG